MLYTISNLIKNRTLALLIAFAMVSILAGCASTTPSSVQTSGSDPVEERAINGLNVSDEANAVKITISGNSPLRYTSVKQAFPLGIVLYFPGTKLDNVDSEYPPEGVFLNSIKTSQQSQASGYDSRVKILLNEDVDYDIMRNDNGLIVSLIKPEGYASEEAPVNEDVDSEEMSAAQEESFTYNETQDFVEEPALNEEAIQPADESADMASMDQETGTDELIAVDESVLLPPEISDDEVEPADIQSMEPESIDTASVDSPDEAPLTPATQIQSIDKVSTENYAEIHIAANGSIDDYDVFTIPSTPEKPARIVCDIFKIQGLKTRGEQSIAINAHDVQSVRYFSYPDKTRVVVDTTDEKLKMYSARSQNSGLIIHVADDMDQAVAMNDTEQGALAIGSLEVGEETAGSEPMYEEPAMGEEEILTDEASDVITEEPMLEEVPVTEAETMAYDTQEDVDDYTEPAMEPDEGMGSAPAMDIETADSTDLQETTDEAVESPGIVVDDYVTETTDDAMAEEPETDLYTETQDDMGDSYETTGVVYEEMEPSAVMGDAWVNRIDFSTEQDGKSAVILGTTHQVDYKITKKDENTIHFRLYNTKLPKSRKYPFITTRFESAVNRIIPAQTTAMKDNALFIIELRESVPYYVDQQGSMITINFEASSVPPQPEDLANLPLWKEVLSKTPEIYDIEMEASELAEEQPVEGEGMPVAAMDEEDMVSPTEPDYGEAPEAMDQEPEDTLAPAETPLVAGTDMETSESADISAGEEEPVETEESESITGDGSFVSWAQKKKYTGEKISVDFFDTDIKNVFRIIRSISGDNFAIDKDVTGKVTMTLDKPVPWDQVLDLVLKMNMLGMISEGGINRIATLETLKQEEEKRLEFIAAEEKTKLKKKSLEPMVTEYILINYSNASNEILPHIEKLMTADRGKISVDERTNQIIMTDTKDKIKEAKNLIQKLDKITPQVIIEARIVEAETTFSRNLGTEWSLNSNPNYDTYNDTLGGTYGYTVAMNNAVAAESSIGINFTRLTGAQFLLNATLLAMESKGEGKIISAPKILTMDNKEATIVQGVEVPFETVSSEGTQTTFKKIELKLNVTPHVTSDNKISLKVLIDKNDVGGVTDLGPTITTKKVESELLIGDGDTIVIGGIIKSNKSLTEQGIPFLYRLPVLGWLFKSRIRSEDKQELLVFLTPRIVSYEEMAQ